MYEHLDGAETMPSDEQLPESLVWLRELSADGMNAENPVISRMQMREINGVLRTASGEHDETIINAVRAAMTRVYAPLAERIGTLIATYLELDPDDQELLRVLGIQKLYEFVVAQEEEDQGTESVPIAHSQSNILREVERRLWVEALNMAAREHVTWADAGDLGRLLQAQELLAQTHEPTTGELADYLQLGEEHVRYLLEMLEPWSIPASLLVQYDEDEGTIASEFETALATVPSAEEVAMDNISREQLLGAIADRLTARELQVLMLRTGYGGEEAEITLAAVGRKLKVTGNRIGQIEERALRKVRRLRSGG